MCSFSYPLHIGIEYGHEEDAITLLFFGSYLVGEEYSIFEKAAVTSQQSIARLQIISCNYAIKLHLSCNHLGGQKFPLIAMLRQVFVNLGCKQTSVFFLEISGLEIKENYTYTITILFLREGC